MKRFWSKVRKSPCCWEWTATTGSTGYGQLRIGSRKDGSTRMVGAHVLSYALHFGQIPAGVFVCHKCDNRKCVRPDHLFLGTQLDNMRDASRKRRLTGNRKTRKLSVDKHKTIMRMTSQGLSQREIGKAVGVSGVMIFKIRRKFAEGKLSI